jgi:hypothetical protein
MTQTGLVTLGGGRAYVPDVILPSPPPSRVYISGQLYRIAAPQVALPPIINVVKLILNWSSTAGNIARNIWHIKTTAPFVTSDPTALLKMANEVQTILASGVAMSANMGIDWTINSTTAKDLGGTTAQAISTVPAVVGTSSANSLAPNCAVVISWRVATSYRGGKPRTYFPAVPTNALNSGGSSHLTPAYANAVQAVGGGLITNLNGMVLTGLSGATYEFGTVSYHTGHAVRPTPLFYNFETAQVHERLDSQRRRLGKESSYPSVP